MAVGGTTIAVLGILTFMALRPRRSMDGLSPPSISETNAGAETAQQTRPRGSESPEVVPKTHGSTEVVNVSFEGREKTPLDQLVDKFNPTADDWDTEVFSDAAKSQLKKLTKFIQGLDQTADVKPLAGLLHNDFVCTALEASTSSARTLVYQDSMIRAWRVDSSDLPLSSPHRGVQGLRDELRKLVDGLGPGPHVRVDLKVFRIDVVQDGFTTHVMVEASNRSKERGQQQNAVWLCQWAAPAGTSQKPLLRQIQLKSYEQVEVEVPGGTLFSDCTEAVMGATPAYSEQVTRSLVHWLPRLGRYSGGSLLGPHGLAVGDVNGDGLEDLYVCDTGNLPNRLYLQNADGTVSDVSGQSGVDWLEHSLSALLIDLDNDGDQDLVVAMSLRLLFAENDGQGRFSLRGSSHAVMEPMSLSAVDYDNDGDLDIFACGYFAHKSSGTLAQPVPDHDANNGGTNALLRNDGQFQFVDVTSETNLNENNSRFSFAAAWDDYDNDGDMDLYVANDFGRNNLYRNDGGRFRDVAAAAGVEDIATGMSAAWADYNRDGWMDIYVGNMYSSAGNRVTYQRRLTNTQPGETLAQLQRMARGNTLFANVGDGTFQDVSEPAAVTMGRWAWSSNFVDLNNDGWQDLVVANGYVTNEDTGDL